MRRCSILCAALSAALFLLIATAPAASPVPSDHSDHAWDKLRWGMNPQEAGLALGHMIVRLENPGRFTHRIDGTYKGYNLAFTFFGSRLERVALMDVGTRGMNERAERLEELLILKYGAPFREEIRNGVNTREWLAADKLVQLYFRGGRNPALNLIYTWRKSAMTDEY